MYGLLVVVMGSRTREIGVRLAIGASPGGIARKVVADSLRNAGMGVALGAVLALVAGRLVQSLLVGVSPSDPLTLAIVVITLLAVSVAAALLPARRAARVDPVEALRGTD
jgi:putative ABC transport system permease protein